MARIIKTEEIKYGDRIRLVQEFTVGHEAPHDTDEERANPIDGDGEVWNREANDYVFVNDDAYEIELVKRENPEIPEGMGHVIRVHDAEGKEGVWITQDEGFIVSSRNIRMARVDFLEFIGEFGFTFEVIA